MAGPRIVTLDIETAPNLGDVWQLFKTNIGLNQIRKDGYIMSMAWKFLDEDYVYYQDNRTGKTDKALVKQMLKVLDEADIVVGHFASRFDIPWVQGEAVKCRLKPPSPFRVIDTLKSIKGAFYLPSYKLEYCARVFGCAPKSSHKKFPGHELWTECMLGNEEAWEEMKDYNIQDVETNEELYLITRPYYKGHPNVGVYMEEDDTVCGRCGSDHIHFRGHYYTNTGKYRKFQCQECGGWGSLRSTEYPKELRKQLGKNVG